MKKRPDFRGIRRDTKGQYQGAKNKPLAEKKMIVGTEEITVRVRPRKGGGYIIKDDR